MIASIPTDVLEGVMELLGLQNRSLVQGFSFAGGGCINSGGRIKTSNGNFFLKWNDTGLFPQMFKAEGNGLNLLRKQECIRIPKVVGYDEKRIHQFLLLEYIDQKSRSEKYWEHLGNRLASLHNATDTSFGLDHDNFIGSLKQYNASRSSWVDFFIEQRLSIQLKLAVDTGHAFANWTKRFQSLYVRLPSLLPEENPSLLHGDLWSGNLIADEKGEPCLIDPAVYFGNREADLAMTKLFGGFDEGFYTAYQDSVPLQPGFHQRVDLYNLYPLLVHVNLFGGGYAGSVDRILRIFA